jgi:hypothetical protein
MLVTVLPNHLDSVALFDFLLCHFVLESFFLLRNEARGIQGAIWSEKKDAARSRIYADKNNPRRASCRF